MISATILTKNSSETLAATLESLRAFPEVLIFDTGSTDQTLAIAGQFPNVKIVEEPFHGFGKAHNRASELASYDWILSIDSDEALLPELSQEILSQTLDPQTVYSMQRCNYFQGKWIKYCSGWYPDILVRLYHRKATRFTDVAVHEAVLSEGLKTVLLRGKMTHTPYRSVEHFLGKMQLYSDLFAEQNRGKPSSLGKALFRGFAAFVKNYIFKRGFLGGREGLIISIHNAHMTYYKYLKLAMQRRPRL